MKISFSTRQAAAAEAKNENTQSHMNWSAVSLDCGPLFHRKWALAIQGLVIRSLICGRYRSRSSRLGLNMIEAEAEHRDDEKYQPQEHRHVHF